MQGLRVARPQTALQSAGLYVSLAYRQRFDHITCRLASTTDDSADIRHEQNPEDDKKDPVRLFNKHLERGTLTKVRALSHLKALTKMTRYDTGLGEATLKWMWDDHDDYEDSEHRPLLEHTIRHLVREGKEELAWNWIEQESRKPENYFPPSSRFIWRSATASALVSARAFSVDHQYAHGSDNRTLSLDGALETFFRAESSSYSIPLGLVRKNVATLLMMPWDKIVVKSTDLKGNKLPTDVKFEIEVPRWPNTSMELWENFFKGIDGHIHNDQPLVVQLPLYHPRAPDAFPYLEHCRYLAEEKKVVTGMVRKPSVIPWTRQGLHAEALLRRQGHEQHADWLEDFVRVLYKRSKWIREKEKAEGRRW